MKSNKIAETTAVSTEKTVTNITVSGKRNKAYERYTNNRMMRLKALERKQEVFITRVQKEFPEMAKEDILKFWDKHNKPQPTKKVEDKPYWTKQGIQAKKNLAELRKERTKTIEFIDNLGIKQVRKVVINVVRIYNKKKHTFVWSIEEALKRFKDHSARRAERLVMREKAVITSNSNMVDKPKSKIRSIRVIVRRTTENGEGTYDFRTEFAPSKKSAEKIALTLYKKHNHFDSSFLAVVCTEYDEVQKVYIPFKVVKKDSIKSIETDVPKKKHYVSMTISSKKEERVFTDPIEILDVLKKNPSGTIKNLPLAIKREVSKYGYLNTVNKYQTLINETAIAA